MWNNPCNSNCHVRSNSYWFRLCRVFKRIRFEWRSENIKTVVRATSRHPDNCIWFFALTVVTPLLQRVIPDLQFFNAISPGIVIGFMMIPTIASLSEDAMRAVAKGIKEASLALGATRFEMVKQVVFPSAFTGIMAAIILATSGQLVKR